MCLSNASAGTWELLQQVKEHRFPRTAPLAGRKPCGTKYAWQMWKSLPWPDAVPSLGLDFTTRRGCKQEFPPPTLLQCCLRGRAGVSISLGSRPRGGQRVLLSAGCTLWSHLSCLGLGSCCPSCHQGLGEHDLFPGAEAAMTAQAAARVCTQLRAAQLFHG